jgi:AAA+ ATPase superfamily predicted ATPase
MFVNRETEMAFLSASLERKHPSAAQFILLYGRRRVGKPQL